jgi:hypothetical protein
MLIQHSSASPTPFVRVVQYGWIIGTWTTNTRGPSCKSTATFNSNGPTLLPTEFGYIEDPPISRSTGNAYANPPPASDFINHWIKYEPTITEKFPFIKTCSIPSGSGEPSVHVPVTGLTGHATTTIRMNGNGPSPPDSTTSRVPAEPITTREPTTTNAPEPGPTSETSVNPPPASTTTTNAPPGNTNPSEPEQPPSATTGLNPNPNPNPNNPQQPAPTTAGPPSNNNPSNPNPSQGPGSPLPIDLTPVPAPVPAPAAPTTAGAPPATQPISPPAVILPNGETLLPGTLTTISDHTVSIPTDAPSTTVIDGTTVQAPPIVVVDGTTATLAPTDVPAPVIPITLGEGNSASVVSVTAAPASGSGVVLPNGQTLLPGSSVTYMGETLVLTTAPESGSTVIQVIDGSTTDVITVPTAASSSVFVYGDSTSTGNGTGSGNPSQTSSSLPEEATGPADELSPHGAVAVLAAMGAAVVLGL